MDQLKKEPTEHDLFVGFDWAGDHHDVVGMDARGQVVESIHFEHTAEGWQSLHDKLSPYQKPGIVIETSSGAIVERLLDAGYAVYAINPKAAKRYRERKAPSGAKSDYADAWSLANALRVDGFSWRRLKLASPIVAEIRLLCQDEVALIEQRTAMMCQLKAALKEYYPAALEAFDNWALPSAWAFVEAFPTPKKLASAGRRRWENFLHKNKLYNPKTYKKRLEVFARAEAFCGTETTTRAKSMLAVAVVAQLCALQKHLNKFRKRIEKLFAEHADRPVYESLPGAAKKIAPRLMALMGDDRERFDSPSALECYSGTAPISFQSGKTKKVRMRQACNKFMRHTVHLWADRSRSQCLWADIYYRQKREQGQSHASALRCLGKRWLKILWKMWQTGTCYDPDLHQRNQVQHGSWVVALSADKSKQTA